MSIIRVKPDVTCSVYQATTDSRIPLTPGMEFDSNDPIVKEFAWAFAFDADSDTQREARQRRTSVEVASAEPGTKRNR